MKKEIPAITEEMEMNKRKNCQYLTARIISSVSALTEHNAPEIDMHFIDSVMKIYQAVSHGGYRTAGLKYDLFQWAAARGLSNDPDFKDIMDDLTYWYNRTDMERYAPLYIHWRQE